MFRETEQGETQYCPMCEQWAEKYERLQAENEELKKEINLYKNSIVANHDRAIGKRFEELLAENEKLKKEVSDLNFYIDSYRQVWEIDKYKQALKEIREIVSEQIVITDKDDELMCIYGNILDKINEVLKDD